MRDLARGNARRRVMLRGRREQLQTSVEDHELRASDRIDANMDARLASRLRRERLKPEPPTRSSKPVVGRDPARAESGARAQGRQTKREPMPYLPTHCDPNDSAYRGGDGTQPHS